VWSSTVLQFSHIQRQSERPTRVGSDDGSNGWGRDILEFPETSLSLIARIKDLADEAAWTEFLGIYRPVVYRMARRRGMQDADAQDVTQRVFLAIAQAINDWEPGPDRPPFRAWLVTITRNAATKALARSRPDMGTGSSSVMELLNAEPAEEENTTAEFLLDTQREALRWAADQLRSQFSEATWRLFWETAVEGRTVIDVAAETGRSAGAIYMARFRVSQRLKEKVLEVSRHWEI
jgi:RNA polymerase sigma-70 factor, ECF subfamily